MTQKRAPRVLYLDQHFAIDEGMTIPRSQVLTKHLAKAGYQITAISGLNRKSGFSRARKRQLLGRLADDGVRLILIVVPYTHFMSFVQRLLSFASFMVMASLRALFLRKPDVVFATSTPLTIGVPALLVSRLRGVPFVFEVRDLWPEFAVDMGILENPLLIRAAEMLERACYRQASTILTISDGLRQRLIERGLPAEKVIKIPIGVDLSFVRSIPPAEDFRRAQGLEGKFVAVYAGAHGPANGLETLLEAAQRLENEKEIVILLIGEGREKARLRQIQETLALSNVRFMDAVPRRELLGILKAMDLGLMITKNLITSMEVCANLPRKFFDYLACGLPVLVTANGEMQEIVESNRAGLASREGDADQLAENVRVLSRDGEAISEMGQNAARISTTYDLENIAALVERQVARLVGDELT